jgi:murein DD-endopeptidase MepM/ murein hydrolase activator NlpD
LEAVNVIKILINQHFSLRRFSKQAAKMIILGAGLSLIIGCNNAQVENLTEYSLDTLAPADVRTPALAQGEAPPPIDTAFLAKLEPCDGFDFPVGPPDAHRYFKARGFLPQGLEHLGEDWNGGRGGNTDFGDYVYAAAGGVVFYADHYNNGWGTVIRILHNYGTAEAPRYAESLYAHVASSWVKPGYVMKRGEIIGTIGSAEGKYHAHLHLEMRLKPGKDIRCGYDGDTIGFVDPTAFIEAHRPL